MPVYGALGRPTRRRAMTLIEILVATTVASVVMGVVVSYVVVLMQKDRQVRLFAVQSDRLNQLAETLRTDIRGASEVLLAAQTVLVIRSPEERETRYEITAGGCRRIVAEPQERKPRVDFYGVGPAAAWSLKKESSGRRPLYIATLQWASTAKKSFFQSPFFVYAALGADLPTPN
jgi:prepilin-type N-terminal cleavage/methylation domain-containing protein